MPRRSGTRRDGVVVDGANVEARVRRLTSAVLRGIHHQFLSWRRRCGDRGDVVVGARGRHARGARAGANAAGRSAPSSEETWKVASAPVTAQAAATENIATAAMRPRMRGRHSARSCRFCLPGGTSADTIAHPREDPSSIGYRCTDATYGACVVSAGRAGSDENRRRGPRPRL